jgi:hypothetical protein
MHRKNKVLKLTSITETVTHHHPFYLETNVMLVSHDGKEHILNTGTKKQQGPLIKRPLPHVFHSFFCI